MIKPDVKNIFRIFSDLILPDYCIGCSVNLLSSRNLSVPQIPLCSVCFNEYISETGIFGKIFEDRCRVCGYPMTSERELCLRCRENAWHFSSSESLSTYRELSKKILREYKFGKIKNLSSFYAYMVNQYYAGKMEGYTLVPVPFRPSSVKKRGWDQVKTVTDLLRTRYKLPVYECLLREDGAAQKTLDYEHRKKNLHGKISCMQDIRPPEKVLLLDDVFTTGATLDCCAEVLGDQGCSEIRCLTFVIDI